MLRISVLVLVAGCVWLDASPLSAQQQALPRFEVTAQGSLLQSGAERGQRVGGVLRLGYLLPACRRMETVDVYVGHTPGTGEPGGVLAQINTFGISLTSALRSLDRTAGLNPFLSIGVGGMRTGAAATDVADCGAGAGCLLEGVAPLGTVTAALNGAAGLYLPRIVARLPMRAEVRAHLPVGPGAEAAGGSRLRTEVSVGVGYRM